jgi:hypothetical protein
MQARNLGALNTCLHHRVSIQHTPLMNIARMFAQDRPTDLMFIVKDGLLEARGMAIVDESSPGPEHTAGHNRRYFPGAIMGLGMTFNSAYIGGLFVPGSVLVWPGGWLGVITNPRCVSGPAWKRSPAASQSRHALLPVCIAMVW